MTDERSARRVLFVSFWVPPRKAVGSIRAAHLLKYLPQFGWDVTALTAPLEGGGGRIGGAEYIETGYFDVKGAVKRIAGIGSRGTHEALNVQVPAYGAKHSLIQRTIYACAGIATYPDEHAGWLPFATSAIRSLVHARKFDAVLSSGPPSTAHIACALGHRRVPWVADLRDLWAEDDSSERSWTQRTFDDRLERWSLSRASALVASSQLSALRFQRRYPGKRCGGIATGFDDDDWRAVPFGEEPACTLLYAGTLYRGKRDPSVLFAAMREIIVEDPAAGEELRLDMYVPRETWLDESIARFQLQGVVRVLGMQPRAEVLAAQRRADLLVLLSWDGRTAEGVVPGKLFEYFGARRPILAIGGGSVLEVENLLRQTGSGVRARTVAEVKREILHVLERRRSGIPADLSTGQVSAFTAQTCARAFAALLNDVSQAQPAPHPQTRQSTALPESDTDRMPA